MFYSSRSTHASMVCSSLALGRRAKPRVSRTEKSRGATDKQALSLERKPRELPARRLAASANRAPRTKSRSKREAFLAREISRPRQPPVPRVRVRCPPDL